MASSPVSLSLSSCRSCSAIAVRRSSTSTRRDLGRHIGAYPLLTRKQAGQQSFPTPVVTVCKGLCANCIRREEYRQCQALSQSPSRAKYRPGRLAAVGS
jgi:hypothetical protein